MKYSTDIQNILLYSMPLNLDGCSCLQFQYEDATVACDGQFYPVHRLVLSACSEYFEQMFALTVGKHPVIVLKDISKEVLETLLKYMYLGEVEVKKVLLSSVIEASQSLKIRGLSDPLGENYPSNESTSSSSSNVPMLKRSCHSSDFDRTLKKAKNIERESNVLPCAIVPMSIRDFKDSSINTITKVSCINILIMLY